MKQFLLADVLIAPDEFIAEFPTLKYSVDGLAEYDEEQKALGFSGTLDFSSYFNGFSLAKWRRYTSISNLRLHLELAGDPCRLSVACWRVRNGRVSVEWIDGGKLVPQGGYTPFDMTLPFDDSVMVSFSLSTEGGAFLRCGRYYSEVEESAVRPIRLLLSTTTFKKEEYILPNIDAVRRELLYPESPYEGSFSMLVVDNGRTLDCEALTGSGVKVVPNDNVGGAGGFARGMLEALDGGYTHVLLMDDDVRVSPESFKRTFAILSLANDRYKDAFLNGAMLSLEHPNLQFEDVARVRRDGIYDRIKEDTFVDDVREAVLNETVDVEVPGAYGAWWFSCIPVSAIRVNGLPLPFFVRCDDVEFGVRNHPTYMTMNGICVWHASFEGRNRGNVDHYQFVRNFLVTLAVDDCASETAFMLRLKRTFDINLRAMAYENAELMLDGLEDYLKGPGFLATASGEALLKEKSAKNEKLVPLDQLDPAVVAAAVPAVDPAYLGDNQNRPFVTKILEILPHDRHMLPDGLLKDDAAPVYFAGGAYPGWRTMGRATLLAVDLNAENGHVRTMDRARYRTLRRRWCDLTAEYRRRRQELNAAYRRALPVMASEHFWREYLGLAPKDGEAGDAR